MVNCAHITCIFRLIIIYHELLYRSIAGLCTYLPTWFICLSFFTIFKQGHTYSEYSQGLYGLLAFGLLGLIFSWFSLTSPTSLTFSTIDSGDTWRKWSWLMTLEAQTDMVLQPAMVWRKSSCESLSAFSFLGFFFFGFTISWSPSSLSTSTPYKIISKIIISLRPWRKDESIGKPGCPCRSKCIVIVHCIS